MSQHSPLSRPAVIATILAAAALALAAPAATARTDPPSPIVIPTVTARTDPPAPATHISAPRVQPTDTGFDWASAGIGAAAAGGLVLVALGGFGATHRARI